MNDLIQSFEYSFNAEPVNELLNDISDTAFDALIDSDAINGIPVLGFLNSVRKINNSIQDYMLAKKMYKFLYNTSNLSIAEKAGFVVDLEEVSHERAFETLFLLIDRIDNVNKIGILTNLIRSRVWGHISIEDFVRLTIVLERIPYPDLKYIKNYLENCDEPGVTEMLNAAGILYASVVGNDSQYKLNSIGEKFLKYGLDYEFDMHGSYIQTVNAAISWEDIDEITKG